MKAFKIVILLLMLLVGRGLFKQKTETTNEEHRLKDSQLMIKVKRELNIKNSKQHLLFSTDSAQQDYMIQLWPKGTVSIMPGGGIKGEFDSLLIRGKQQQVAKLSEMLNTLEEHKGNMVTGLLDSKRTNFEQKHIEKKSSYNLKWILLSFGLVVFLVLLFLWQKFR